MERENAKLAVSADGVGISVLDMSKPSAKPMRCTPTDEPPPGSEEVTEEAPPAPPVVAVAWDVHLTQLLYAATADGVVDVYNTKARQRQVWRRARSVAAARGSSVRRRGVPPPPWLAPPRHPPPRHRATRHRANHRAPPATAPPRHPLRATAPPRHPLRATAPPATRHPPRDDARVLLRLPSLGAVGAAAL